MDRRHEIAQSRDSSGRRSRRSRSQPSRPHSRRARSLTDVAGTTTSEMDATDMRSVCGATPYSDLCQTGVPNLIDDMNRQDLEFSVHDGDLKGQRVLVGTPTTCSDAMCVAGARLSQCAESRRSSLRAITGPTGPTGPTAGFPLSSASHERQLFFTTVLWPPPLAAGVQTAGSVEASPACVCRESSVECRRRDLRHAQRHRTQ
jgi:hypothetical protein